MEGTLEKEVGRGTIRAWMNTDPWFLGHTPSHRTMSSLCSYGFLPFPLPFRLLAYHSTKVKKRNPQARLLAIQCEERRKENSSDNWYL